MSDSNINEEMVSELGIDPALDVDSDQRAELLRRWHEEQAAKDEERKDQPK
jgi:hypothetical protein